MEGGGKFGFFTLFKSNSTKFIHSGFRIRFHRNKCLNIIDGGDGDGGAMVVVVVIMVVLSMDERLVRFSKKRNFFEFNFFLFEKIHLELLFFNSLNFGTGSGGVFVLPPPPSLPTMTGIISPFFYYSHPDNYYYYFPPLDLSYFIFFCVQTHTHTHVLNLIVIIFSVKIRNYSKFFFTNRFYYYYYYLMMTFSYVKTFDVKHE